MIQTFIALLTEQNAAEMKYGRNEADIFYLKVLLPSNVSFESHIFLRLLKYIWLFLQGKRAAWFLKGHGYMWTVMKGFELKRLQINWKRN